MITTLRSWPRRFGVIAVLAAAVAAAPGLCGSAEGNISCCPDLSGNWDCGSWQSSGSGHSGKLRATLTRSGRDAYRCTFCGSFFKVVPFRYTVTLHVTGCRDGRVFFRASRNLPVFGGTFTCSGSATGRSFRATYTSPKDRGTFVLSR